MLSLVRPRYFVPVHGEYRQLARHARVAQLVTSGLPAPVKVLLAENGDIVRFDAEGGRLVDKAPAGRVLIDGTRVGEVDDEVLRDRRHLAADGLVVPVVAINRQTGGDRRRARLDDARLRHRRRHHRRSSRKRA